MKISYRTWFKGIPPRKVKLQEWAGERTYSSAQPWHCKPFVDAATYGYELVYPFTTTCEITAIDGKITCHGDFSQEKTPDQQWEFPFTQFAPGHFGFTSSLDIKTPENISLLVLPHPRLYTDNTGTVPLAISGLLNSSWWSNIFFVVFKSPNNGQKLIFRYNEPYAKIIFLPTNPEPIDMVPMDQFECKQRAYECDFINRFRKRIASKIWWTDGGDEFDNKYKVIGSLVKKFGIDKFFERLKEYLPKKITIPKKCPFKRK